ncbi:MAG: serine/threonine protein kinase [Labilithrix sp.]|nr:serine/threonine protein kinase [Labilithrix sp.]MCW5813630.1 serine/threonine protein kinase [Labilithrix sp.]
MAQLGKYQLVAEIARGGMGIVYLAVARGPARFNKLLVVKQLKPELVEDTTFLEMFLEEARLAARLSHPNIVQTYEIGNDDNRHYMVMDYLEGVTLARVLKKKKESFTLAMHLRILCEALQGLHHAHTLTDFDNTPLGIVHRDATPQNLFVTFDGQVKVVDFGIAKALDSSLETKTGVLKGKPSYMAPEQIAGDVDPRSDVFTAGVMIWEAVAGRRMWARQSDVEILTHIIKGEVPSLATEVPDAPAELVRIVEKALKKSRDERYESAASLQEDLEKYLTASGMNVSLREIGKVVAEIFAGEREQIRGTIEKHLASIAAGKEAEQTRLPSIRPPVSGEGNTPAGQHTSEPSIPSSPTGGKTPAGTELPSTPVAASAAPAAPGGRMRTFVVAAIVAVVAIGGTAVAMRSKDPGPVASPTPPPPAPTEAPVVERKTAPQPAGPTTHEVAVKALPKTSVLSIDGVEVSNPVTRRCEHGRSFTVHVSAGGHVSQDRTLSCDKDQSVEIALTSAPIGYVPPKPKPATPSAPVASVPAAPEPKATDVGPQGGAKPNRPIDTASPYK